MHVGKGLCNLRIQNLKLSPERGPFRLGTEPSLANSLKMFFWHLLCKEPDGWSTCPQRGRPRSKAPLQLRVSAPQPVSPKVLQWLATSVALQDSSFESMTLYRKKVKTKCVRKEKRSQKAGLCDLVPVVCLRDVNCCKGLWGRAQGISTRHGQSHCHVSSLSRHTNPSVHPVNACFHWKGRGSSSKVGMQVWIPSD